MISIFKFGGSCLKNVEAFEKIHRIMELHSNEKKIFVVSALQGITDMLVKTAENASDHDFLDGIQNQILEKHITVIKEIFNNFPKIEQKAIEFINRKLDELKNVLSEIEEFGLKPYFMDYVVSYGEKMSTFLLFLYVTNLNIPAKYIKGEEIIITDSNFGNCLPKWNFTAARIKKVLGKVIEDPNDRTIFCITGFVGRNRIGYTTTLGRGGSDFTATIIARSLYDTISDKNIRVVLWKDVDGILATNPKYVKNPKLIKNLNYDEAKEMAFYGANILHPKCLFGLEERHIPVEIRNFSNPESVDFSIIGDSSGKNEITGISTIEDVSLLSVSSASLVSTPGVLAKIFAIMGDNNINVSLVAQSSSEINTTFIVEKNDGKRAYNLIKSDEFFMGWTDIKISDNVSIIAITGKGVNKSSVQARIFKSLAEKDIIIIAMSQSSDGLNLSFVINKNVIGQAVNLINKCVKSMQ
ncbi:MAG: aspartate kinase [Promethearchaeota archaeon]